jgi:hypothetical protein
MLEVSTADGVLNGAGMPVVVPFEEHALVASGYAPNGSAELLAEQTDLGILVYFDMTFDASGNFLEVFYFEPGSRGVWRMTLAQPDPLCQAEAHLEVLPLDDVSDNKFLTHIKWLFLEGITSGCSDHNFCPDGLLTRGQMATFLVRALGLPATSTDYFTDDETNKHEPNINRLRAAGITTGCGGTKFCPNRVVTRGQMATFLARAFSLPATSTDYFTDDETNTHEANINRLRAANITLGCSATTFCPNRSVTRGQMSAFLHRAPRVNP